MELRRRLRLPWLLCTLAILVGSILFWTTGFVSLESSSADAQGCTGAGPLSVTASETSTNEVESIAASGCAFEGQLLEIQVVAGAQTVAIATPTASPDTGGVWYPPGCTLPEVKNGVVKPGTCKGRTGIVPGGSYYVNLTVDAGCFSTATNKFEVVASQAPWTSSTSTTSVPDTVNEANTAGPFPSQCLTATVTTLSLPSPEADNLTTVDPASVSAGSGAVTTGTITISVNGNSVCTYTAGASSGCVFGNLPVGTDQVEASYVGGPVPPNQPAPPWYGPSSASETVTVFVPTTTGVTAPNWAGYVLQGQTYTSVSGSWTVPSVSCGSDAGSVSSTWVGIDGFNEQTVEQTGTYSNCVIFTNSFGAWWEMVPTDSVQQGINEPVSPGDQMTASVVFQGTPGFYFLDLSNDGNGNNKDQWSFTTEQFDADNPTNTTAEWITEHTSTAPFSFPLAPFGSVTFTSAVAGTGPAGTISDSPIRDFNQNEEVNMVQNPGTALATTLVTTSSLFSNGTAFTTTWQHG